MNVTLPDNKLDKKAKFVYISIIGVCIISIILVVYAQFFEGRTVTTVGNLKGKSETGYEVLKSEFDELFTNSIQQDDDKYQTKKVESTKKIVYTGYKNNEKEENSYSLDVNIPYINIKNNIIEKYNEEIKNTFENKAEEIIKTKNKNSIYTVEYSSYIQEDILSIIIRANLKEGTNAQRVIIKTYNYSLNDNKEINLKYLLQKENVEISYAQNRIDEEIKSEQKKADDLKALGYPIYERNINSEIYKVDNISDFYFHDGSIYVIFAYGNEKFTSEVDIAIL